ncbi:MAG: acyl-ACP--UDP-N-acetylglucosamine O-acyltransferase [Bacteroidetes bacterium]|jgi:UDP-N-acetylglucosamine acyltransferase|nr:acyl-ACP--UDP-N-acetylglucosamine O-acyltransferase [Bacteroidota bacterium]
MNQPLANIHPEAKIADSAIIEPFATIAANVVVDEGSWIGPNAVLMDGARIGKNCKIFPGAVLSAIPQDLKYQGEQTTVEIGDNTTIRECVTINKGTKAKGKTVIGSNCLVMCYVHIAHDCIIGNQCILGGYAGLAGEVEVSDWANISGGSLVHQFVKIGSHVMIQGGSKVGKDVPPFVLAGRDPLSFAGINSVGLRRRNFSNEKINELQEIYRTIYQKGLNNTEAIVYVEENFEKTEELEMIVGFIRGSKRGIIRGILD